MADSDYLALRYGRAVPGKPAMRYDRAPAWARRELDLLAREVLAMRNVLAHGPADSDTFADTLPSPGAPMRPLGKGAGVLHRFPNGMEAIVLWEDDDARPVVEIITHSGRAVVELGGGSNSARIRLEPR